MISYFRADFFILINVTVKPYGFAEDTEQSPIFRTVKNFLQIALEKLERMFYNRYIRTIVKKEVDIMHDYQKMIAEMLAKIQSEKKLKKIID